MKNKKVYFLTVFLVLFIIMLLQIGKIEPFESFSLRFNDTNFNLQDKTPSKEIVFVAVDEPSVNKFGRWPWDRQIIAEGLHSLTQANIVLFDMIFSEPTTLKADTALANSIASLNTTVCGFFLKNKATQEVSGGVEELLSDSSLDLLHSQIAEFKNPTFVQAPFAELNTLNILESCTLSGSFSTLTQSDKLFRSYPLAVYYKETLFPSLAVQALRLKFNSDLTRISKNILRIDGHNIHINERGFVRLNFYKREQYNIVSFLDVIEKKIDASYFKDKIVIFGITDVGSGDVVSTPVGFMFGPLLHYTFLSNVLQNHLIIEPLYWDYILTCVLTLLPLFLLLFIKRVLHRAVITIGIYLSVYMIIRALFVYEMFYIDLFYPFVGLLLSIVSLEALAFRNHEKSSKFLKDAFSSYLSQDLLQELVKNPDALTLGGEKKELSILFSDIRGFTSFSEKMDPVDLVDLLNRYFTPMTQSVLHHNGMLDKYIGDAIMAFYNAPITVENHADEVCATALEMLEALHVLNQELQKENIPLLAIGIGINTADVVVGNMGSKNRFNYTIMGDGVNLASRLESLTKMYGVSILVSEFTIKKLTQTFLSRKIQRVIVKGKEEAILLYELMQNSDENRALKDEYDAALQVYMQSDLKSAHLLFKEIVEKYNDTVSQYFLDNIEKGTTWDVQTMQTK